MGGVFFWLPSHPLHNQLYTRFVSGSCLGACAAKRAASSRARRAPRHAPPSSCASWPAARLRSWGYSSTCCWSLLTVTPRVGRDWLHTQSVSLLFSQIEKTETHVAYLYTDNLPLFYISWWTTRKKMLIIVANNKDLFKICDPDNFLKVLFQFVFICFFIQ